MAVAFHLTDRRSLRFEPHDYEGNYSIKEIQDVRPSLLPHGNCEQLGFFEPWTGNPGGDREYDRADFIENQRLVR